MYVPEFDLKHLKNVYGDIGRNVGNITIKAEVDILITLNVDILITLNDKKGYVSKIISDDFSIVCSEFETRLLTACRYGRAPSSVYKLN